MDTVKQGRAKVSEGDCVSVPNDYFGADYLVSLQTVGVTEDSPYGRVVRLINGNQLSDVKWDVEGDESKTSLNSVSLEARDTPIQQPNPFDKQVFNSSTATTSHALLEEKYLMLVLNPTHLMPPQFFLSSLMHSSKGLFAGNPGSPFWSYP